MPRKGHIQKRDVLADPLYNDKVVTKLINNIMLDGKKGVAQKIVYGAFGRVEEKSGKPALEVFEEAMNNIMPVLEVKARRVGGATYQVPIEVRADRRQALGLRWLVTFSRKRGEKTMEKRRHAQNGRSEQGFLPLQILIPGGSARPLKAGCQYEGGRTFGWKRISIRENQKHWYYGSYRCG